MIPPTSEKRFDEFHDIDCNLQSSLKHVGPAFFQSFGRFTQIQRLAIPDILAGKDTLLISATATGKTEAACAPLIERFYSSHKPWTILYISPTRALINDLYFRLQRPVRSLNLTIKRRTGDHRDNLSQIPNILITTPESFDSLLCRNRRNDKYGHDLAHVRAVILDEIHLLYGTSRGEQLKWLLKRLQKIKVFSKSKGWCSTSDIQIVCLSATVPNSQRIADEYFPEQVSTIQLKKHRPIEIVNIPSEKTNVESMLFEYISCSQKNEKVIVFTNRRRRVDDLASILRRHLTPFGYGVHAHHGSLSKNEREYAEFSLKSQERIVLVATSTLEIGIDIGDIDLIVLESPPPDISSFLQRIGRGNRRTDKTRVMLCANNVSEFLLQQAMAEAAKEGWLGEDTYGPYYSVVRQQIASYIFQSPKKMKTTDSVAQLFSESHHDSKLIYDMINHMISNQELVQHDKNVLKLGDHWWQMAENMGMIHSTIERGAGNNIVNIDTGNTIASGVHYLSGKNLGIAGKSLQICNWDKFKIEVRDHLHDSSLKGNWSYNSRSFYLSSCQPLALKRYLKISNDIWPIIQKDGFTYIFHCGGAIRRAILTLIHEHYGIVNTNIVFNDWYIQLPGLVRDKPQVLSTFSSKNLYLLINSEESLLAKIESFLNRPYSNKQLPYNVRVEEVLQWLNLEHEEKLIKSSNWLILEDKDVESALKLFINSAMPK